MFTRSNPGRHEAGFPKDLRLSRRVRTSREAGSANRETSGARAIVLKDRNSEYHCCQSRTVRLGIRSRENGLRNSCAARFPFSRAALAAMCVFFRES